MAVKRIREIMAGADVNLHPPTQPQGMPVSSPVPTPSFNQPLAIFDRQPLPPGVCTIIYKLRNIKETVSCSFCCIGCAQNVSRNRLLSCIMNCKGKTYQVDYAWTSS